ncbi:MAG: hypothetical protein ABIY39_05250 [Sphingomonas sp.]
MAIFVSLRSQHDYIVQRSVRGLERDIRRIGVSPWIETVIVMTAALWLLLFVAPALFNAHTSTGLWSSIFLFLLSPLVLAAMLTRIVRALHATGKDDGRHIR